MQANKKNMFLLLLLPTLSGFVFLSSCSGSKGPIEIVFPPTGPPERPRSSAVEKRFQRSIPQGPTTVETVIDLSKKHAKLAEEAASLRQEKLNFITENNLLKEQIADSRAQLQQTQKELTEANDLLIEMTIELNNWKTNIVGFQKEMRKADTAQLQALLKIFEILGGEVKTESDQAQDAASTQLHLSRPEQSRTQKLQTLTLGESND